MLLHKNRKTTWHGISRNVEEIQTLVDLLSPGHESIGSERSGRWRENSAYFGRREVSGEQPKPAQNLGISKVASMQ